MKPLLTEVEYAKMRYEEAPERDRSGWLVYIQRTHKDLYEEIQAKEGEQQ